MTKPRISVITVTRNAVRELRMTVDSVRAQKWSAIQHIVIDGESEDGSKEYLSGLSRQSVHWLSEPDAGIYDAMNKGIALATGDYILFLNAGDTLEGQVLLPGMDFERLLPVRSFDFWGRSRFLRVRNIRLGMPYCHQGIIFRNGKLTRFDTKYEIAADYGFLIDNLNLAGMKPPDLSSKGAVVFDSSGVSSTRIIERDVQAGQIIRQRFGWMWWVIFWIRQSAKLIVRLTVLGFPGRSRSGNRT